MVIFSFFCIGEIFSQITRGFEMTSRNFKMQNGTIIMPFAVTWLDLEFVLLSKAKSGRERQISYETTYMWNPKQQYK